MGRGGRQVAHGEDGAEVLQLPAGPVPTGLVPTGSMLDAGRLDLGQGEQRGAHGADLAGRDLLEQRGVDGVDPSLHGVDGVDPSLHGVDHVSAPIGRSWRGPPLESTPARTKAPLRGRSSIPMACNWARIDRA